MSIKLLLISSEGTIGKDGRLLQTRAKELANLIKELMVKGVQVALWSNKQWTVNGSQSIQAYLSELVGNNIALHGYAEDGKPIRRFANSVEPILTQYNAKRWETVLVGAMDEDMIAGVNNKLLLLKPTWYGNHMEYGFPFDSVADLGRFLKLFAMREHPIFWHISSGGADTRAAGPFSTMIPEFSSFGASAKEAAKHGTGLPEFWFSLVVASVYFSGLIHDIDYICAYPGHDPSIQHQKLNINETLSRLAKCFNKPFFHNLIVRHTITEKSQPIKTADRNFLPQLNTMMLNSAPNINMSERTKQKLQPYIKKRVALVIDDICTSGHSFESARAYIEAAGGRAKMFSWLKTINSAVVQMDGIPALKPFQKNTLLVEPPHHFHAYADGIVDVLAPTEIKLILEAYKSWS